MPIRSSFSHIPFALPRHPWIMRQSWHELMFLHWPVPVDMLRPLLPSGLAPDTFDGAAWVGVVPFTMRGVAPRGLPSVPWLSAFPEINLRTYVTVDGKPGVWFFCLDAGNPVAVSLARTTFHLPYFNAAFQIHHNKQEISYAHQRTHRGAVHGAFQATYRPIGPVFHAQPASLAYFLTERYCLYTTNNRGQILRGIIGHAPWELQAGAAEIGTNTLAAAHGITLPDCPPLLHYAHRQQMVAWALERVAR